MNANTKRKDTMQDDNNTPKRVKKECSYGEKCYRRNPAHFREFSHPHLESILDSSSTPGDYVIPDHLSIQKYMIVEQLEVIVEKQLYEPKRREDEEDGSLPSTSNDIQPSTTKYSSTGTTQKDNKNNTSTSDSQKNSEDHTKMEKQDNLTVQDRDKSKSPADRVRDRENSKTPVQKELKERKPVNECGSTSKTRGPDYVPIVPPTRRPQEFFKVVRPPGKMAAKHAASAPYHIFYTTIDAAKETHDQPYSITFLEILDSSFGELKCSLQINFMVEIAWLMAQYYFAGYSEKTLTVLYGDDSMPNLKDINTKKPQVDAHYVKMASPFGKHHTKMMVLCYEDGSLRVVVSTANLYEDDWQNRTQGLWISPSCPELPPDAMPFDGESPTQFKKYLLNYLHHYHMPQLSYYIERVKRCDFSHINVFLVSSAPGGHFDHEWGMTRVGSLLRQHCNIPAEENRKWPLIAQASSLGSYGKDAKQWLTGDFLHNFAKIKNQPQMLSQPPELRLIYPALENVRSSHDGLLGGGCLPYAASSHEKQPWLNNFLYQWKATHTSRDRAMPHIKSYTRASADGTKAAFYLMTSANVSKAAWGQINKGNAALRIMSYEAGVLFLPTFVINKDYFPLSPGASNRLVIPYDIPPTKYTEQMTPWVQDYLFK